MLNYKDIIIKHYALSLSGSEIARQLGASKSGVNDFLRAFDKCESLSYPLPPGITNYGIAELVYGSVPGSGGRNESIEYPDYEADAKLMATRKNMTLVFLWNRYSKKCAEEGKRFYQYRQYCELYNKWCDENYETAHFDAVIAQKMEVDFAGQTFDMTDPLTGETLPIVVFVAIGRHGKTCDRKVSGSAGPGRKRPSDRIHRCMDDVSEVRQWTSPLPSGERLETVWCPDQQDDTCKLDYLLLQELLTANV